MKILVLNCGKEYGQLPTCDVLFCEMVTLMTL